MDEVFDPTTETEAKKTARNRLNVYEKTLREVKRVSGSVAMRSLALWLKEVMREENRVPTGREVREEGGRNLRDLGYDVPADSWLNP